MNQSDGGNVIIRCIKTAVAMKATHYDKEGKVEGIDMGNSVLTVVLSIIRRLESHGDMSGGFIRR